VVGAGGACAIARPGAAINTHESRSDWLIRMGRERPADAVGSPGQIPGVTVSVTPALFCRPSVLLNH
jgi:hypothetical protein